MAPEPVATQTARVTVAADSKYSALLSEGNVLRRCTDYLRELLTSLDLPEPAEIIVVTAEPPSRSGDIRLTINGTTVTARSIMDLDADGLTQLISSALYRCRELLLDESMIDRLWSAWFPEHGIGAPGDPPAGLAEFFRELVRRGIRPVRARDSLAALNSIAALPSDLEQAIEEALSQRGIRGIRLLVSAEQYAHCFDNTGKALPLPSEDSDFATLLQQMSDGLFWELGIIYPMEGMQMDPTLQAPWFRIAWNDVVTPPIKGLASDEFLVNGTVDRLGLLNLKGVTGSAAALNPANGVECARVSGGFAAADACKEAGLTTWGPEGYLMLHVSSVIRRNAGALVTSHLTQLYVAQLEQSFPELVGQALKRFGGAELTRIMRLLSDEEISIRDLRAILEALLAVNSVSTADLVKYIVFPSHCGLACPVAAPRTVKDLRAADYADCVRMVMKRYISHKCTRGSSTLAVYLLDPGIEERLRNETPLSAEERSELLDAVDAEFGDLARTYQNPVILTTHYARRRLRKFLEYDFPAVAVLSYQELTPETNIQPIAKISPRGEQLSRVAKQ